MTQKQSKGREEKVEKVEKVMHEFKEGTLESGSGQMVTDRKQAIAIALSEARDAGEKIHLKPTSGKSKTKKINKT